MTQSKNKNTKGLKILNLYGGIGGNRKLWGDEHDITAVEYDREIANVYRDYFPDDKVIVTDAHQYLLDHYKEFDFIWSSPPCQSHTVCNNFLHAQGIIRYPDMNLYQEIVFLQKFYEGGFCIENVIPYYKPLIPAQQRGRHLLWSNFYIREHDFEHQIGGFRNKARKAPVGFVTLDDLKDYKLKSKEQIIRNCVLPELGRHILDCYESQKPGLLEYRGDEAQGTMI